MFTLFNKPNRSTSRRRYRRWLIGALFLVGVLMGLSSISMSLASAKQLGSNGNTNQSAASTAPIAKASFTSSTCEHTYGTKGGWQENGYGHVQVKNDGSAIDVIERVRGKWSKTHKVAANSSAVLDYYSPSTDRLVSFQLRDSSGRYIAHPLNVDVCFR